MNRDQRIRVGVIGLGVIGGQVARVLLHESNHFAYHGGVSLVLCGAADSDPVKLQASGLPSDLMTEDATVVLNNPDVDIVVELIGGVNPAMDFIESAFSKGKHVVTANKELMAKHGPRLIDLSEANGVHLLYEASVGGGIPIIGPLKRDLLANKITRINAIINGTTNYIISKMSGEKLDFNSALNQAQDSGFAESDPTSDIDGFDAVYKLVIMVSLAFDTHVRVEDVYREGISTLEPQDLRYADDLGYTVKLLATARYDKELLSVRVHPALIPHKNLLAKVDGVFNAIEIEGDLVGSVIFHGQGAGPMPTSSAVIGDIIEIARNIVSGTGPVTGVKRGFKKEVAFLPIEDLNTKYYIRLKVGDQAGVMAQISRVFGDLDISIAGVIQKNADNVSQTAEVVIITHLSKEGRIREAVSQLKRSNVVKQIANVIRVEECV